MGYENLSYSNGKMLGNVKTNNFIGSGQEALEVGQAEDLSASESGFFNFQLDFPP